MTVSTEGAEGGDEGSAASAGGQATTRAMSPAQQYELEVDDSRRPPLAKGLEVIKVRATATVERKGNYVAPTINSRRLFR